jgi:hypothetical protein
MAGLRTENLNLDFEAGVPTTQLRRLVSKP